MASVSRSPRRGARARRPALAAASFAAMLALSVPTAAHAYLDPGSGSILLQLVLGGVASVAVAGRLFWRRLRDRFRPPSKTELSTPPAGTGSDVSEP